MKRRLLSILSLLISLVLLSSCGYVTLEPSSADASSGTSTEDVIAAMAQVDEGPESSEVISSEEPSSSVAPSSSKAVSSKAASSKAKVTTVAGDNDYSVSVEDKDDPEIEEDKSYTVYITDTGEKYHRSGCRYLSKSKYAISRDDARAQGYTPCKVCKPG